MAVVDIAKLGMDMTIQKKLKKSTVFFPLKPWAGVNAFPNLEEGVYKIYHIGVKQINIRCKLYSPVNHKTPNQLAWQAIYRAGVVEYKSLTDEQREVYHKRATGKHYSGYNIFMKEYLLAH